LRGGRSVTALDEAMSWHSFQEGRSIGLKGSEDGAILNDEEYAAAARITLEQAGRTAPYAITCGLYGWMLHTRYFESQSAAESAFTDMKEDLASILLRLASLRTLPAAQQLAEVSPLLQDFLEKYP
jgi:hypothetical protein